MNLSALSPTTRILAAVVFLACGTTLYVGQRIRPAEAEQKRMEKRLERMEKDIDSARLRVTQLRSEQLAAERWSSYSKILADQSTGRSFQGLIESVENRQIPGLGLTEFRLERARGSVGLSKMAFELRATGGYDELQGLLFELDRVFPPVELHHVELTKAETDEAQPHEVEIHLKGHVHEPE